MVRSSEDVVAPASQENLASALGPEGSWPCANCEDPHYSILLAALLLSASYE